jgi:hypothetical protein
MIEFRPQTSGIPELLLRAAKSMSGKRDCRLHFVGRGRPGRTDPRGNLVSILGACMGIVSPGDRVCLAEVELALASKDSHERGYVGECGTCHAVNWTLTT